MTISFLDVQELEPDLRLANVSIRPDFTLGGGGEAGEVWLSEEPSLTVREEQFFVSSFRVIEV